MILTICTRLAESLVKMNLLPAYVLLLLRHYEPRSSLILIALTDAIPAVPQYHYWLSHIQHWARRDAVLRLLPVPPAEPQHLSTRGPAVPSIFQREDQKSSLPQTPLIHSSNTGKWDRIAGC